jgi:tetratricopeptide (TPR) repeat protein
MRTRPAVATALLLVLSAVSVPAQTRVHELNEAGWRALKTGDAERATAIFGEALTSHPDDPVLLLGAGAAAQARGQQREAMSRLKRALEIRPDLTVASELLGMIAYQAGEVALAIRTYEEALTHAPDAVQLTNALIGWRADAAVHHTFEERRFDRFTVLFEGRAEESLAARATGLLDTAFRRIGSTLGQYPTETIVAILYTDKQFRDITRAPEWSGGQYDGRIRIPAAGAALAPELFEQVLTHELSHAIVEKIAPQGVPAWLNEGIAQHFEGADVRAAARRVKAGRAFPLRQLERGFGRMNAADAQMAYDESLVAATVMFERPGFGWTRLLHALAAGQPFERAIVSFGFSYEDLESGFGKTR